MSEFSFIPPDWTRPKSEKIERARKRGEEREEVRQTKRIKHYFHKTCSRAPLLRCTHSKFTTNHLFYLFFFFISRCFKSFDEECLFRSLCYCLLNILPIFCYLDYGKWHSFSCVRYTRSREREREREIDSYIHTVYSMHSAYNVGKCTSNININTIPSSSSSSL